MSIKPLKIIMGIKQLKLNAKNINDTKEIKKKIHDYEWYSLRHMLSYAN